jgi:hypothetical protein
MVPRLSKDLIEKIGPAAVTINSVFEIWKNIPILLGNGRNIYL